MMYTTVKTSIKKGLKHLKCFIFSHGKCNLPTLLIIEHNQNISSIFEEKEITIPIMAIIATSAMADLI